MTRHSIQLVMIGSSLALLASAANTGQDPVTVKDLDPFTHVVRISADAEQSSIRFEQVKLVKIPTKVRFTEEARYCEQLAFRDPGGSSYCPNAAYLDGAWRRKDTQCKETIKYKTVTAPSEYATLRIGLSGTEQAVTATAEAGGRR